MRYYVPVQGGCVVEILIPFGALGLLLVLSFVAKLIRERKLKRLLQAFGTKQGLEFQDNFSLKNCRLRGDYRGVPLTITVKYFSRGKSSILTLGFEVSHFNINVGHLHISAENMGKKIGKFLGNKDLEIGDHRFDELAWVESSGNVYARAYLGRRARQLIGEFIKDAYSRFFIVNNNKIRTWQVAENFTDVTQLETICGDITTLASLLSRNESLPILLRENVAEEQQASMKIPLLDALGQSEGNLEIEDPLIQESLEDPDKKLRFAAIRLLGAKGYPLMQTLFPECSEELQTEMLEYGTERTAKELAPFFQGIARGDADPKVKTALAQYFGAVNYEGAETFLQAELESKERRTEKYNAALIQALGRCGSYASIEFLDRRRNPLNARLIDQAIAEIQERIRAGDGGWLSIQEPHGDDGKLSLSEDIEES